MKNLLVLLAIMLSTFSANAQSSISLGANSFNGNYRSAGFTAKADVKKAIRKYELSTTAIYRWSKQSAYGKTDLVQYEDESYLSANLAKRIGKFKVMGFTENERSYMRSIDLRSSLGIGAGFQVLKDSVFDILISELVLPEYYWSSENDTYNNSTLRASTRLKIEIEKGSIKGSSVTLFQPAILSTRQVNFSDNLNVRSTNSVEVKVSKWVSIGALYIVSYEGYPYYINKAVVPLQQTASLMIKYSF